MAVRFETLSVAASLTCQATCDDSQSHGGPCGKRAKYRIIGKPVCRRHGGALALDLLTSEEAPNRAVDQLLREAVETSAKIDPDMQGAVSHLLAQREESSMTKDWPGRFHAMAFSLQQAAIPNQSIGFWSAAMCEFAKMMAEWCMEMERRERKPEAESEEDRRGLVAADLRGARNVGIELAAEVCDIAAENYPDLVRAEACTRLARAIRALKELP